jgi:hypothetical protein
MVQNFETLTNKIVVHVLKTGLRSRGFQASKWSEQLLYSCGIVSDELIRPTLKNCLSLNHVLAPIYRISFGASFSASFGANLSSYILAPNYRILFWLQFIELFFGDNLSNHVLAPIFRIMFWRQFIELYFGAYLSNHVLAPIYRSSFRKRNIQIRSGIYQRESSGSSFR